jgi:CBS domain containing-hemolysin-like protein
MIILVDEYGGVAGLLTLKEMVEEIVGPMSELGEDDEEYLAIDQDTYQVDGSLDIDEADGELARVSLMVPTRPLADLYRPAST